MVELITKGGRTRKDELDIQVATKIKNKLTSRHGHLLSSDGEFLFGPEKFSELSRN